MKLRFLGALTALGFLIPVQPTFAIEESSVNGEPVVRNQAIVRIDAEVENPEDTISDLGYEVIETFGEESDNTFLVELNPFVSTSSQISRLDANKDLVYAEPNFIFSLSGPYVSDDPSFVDGSTWGMEGSGTTPASQYGSNAAGAWANGFIGSSDVYVAVIDAGINYNHPDLAANIWTNPLEANGTPGVDDDGDGFIDDVHGYDFVNDDASVYDAGSENRHGTHVAGTIAAVGGNGVGVAGVTWNTKLISVKVMGPDGTGSLSSIIRGIDYVTMLRTKLGLDIIASNNSYGSEGGSLAMQDAIRRGGDAGIVFVAAAGNDGLNNDSTSAFPANIDCKTKDRPWDCVVSVGAMDSSGAIAGFSNYGTTKVDLLAPGVNVLSTTIDDGSNGGYEYLSGTSMAAPHVTGALALCVGSYRGTSAEEAIDLLYSTGADTASAVGKTATGKRLDAGALASACYDKRTAFSGNHSDVYASAIYTDRVRLDWADTVAGDYEQEIQYSVGPAGCTGTFQHLAYIGPGLTSYPINNLEEAQFYCFRIRANNQSTNSSYVKSNVSITWTSNLPFVGGKVQLPDGTTVANVPVKWLADGVNAGLGNVNASTTYTNESGEYVLQISNGTTGKLFVDVSRYANSKRVSSPQLPWGLSAGGKLTVTQDVTKDITVPQSHVMTFDVADSGSNPLAGTQLQNATLSNSCNVSGYLPFAGATNVVCDFWPTGYAGTMTGTNASGQSQLALVDAASVTTGGYDILAFNPSDLGQVEKVRVIPTEAATVAVTMDATSTLSGHVYMADGVTPVSGATVRWNAKGLLVNGDYTFAKSVTTDSNGAYSVDVSAGTPATLFLSTTKYPSLGGATTPLLPWGLTATGDVTTTVGQTLDLKAPPVVQYDLTVQQYESTTAVSGAKVISGDLAVSCKAGTYSLFAGATSTGCSHLPTGYTSYLPKTNSQGQISLALLKSSVLATNKTYALAITDPKYATRTTNLTITPTADQTMTVHMPAPVTISGTVYLADGVTPVANAPVKWLGEGQDGGVGNASATTVYTNSQGQYSISASMGTPGELFVETSRYAYTQNKTSPLLPWGMHAGGNLTVATDAVVDLVMPSFHYATFNVQEYASNELVEDADLESGTLGSACKTGSYTAFTGAIGSSCSYWPGGYAFASPTSGADGVIKIGLLDTRYYTTAPSFVFAIKHPMDAARVSSKTITVNNTDQVITVDMPGTPSKPEQPSATAETGKVVLTWDEPWSDGGSFIDHYEVWVSLAADGPFELVPAGSCQGQLGPDTRTCEVEGLTPGTTYYFAIIAHNVYGYGAKSLSVSSSPIAQIQDLTLTPTPTISGTAAFGQTLTATAGTWDNGVSLSYQWRRDGAPILGATNSSYALSISDVGTKLSVAVTGVKTGFNSVTTTSSETATVTVSQLTTTPTPTISGTATEGQALSVTAGSWDAGVTKSYQWLRSGIAIADATGLSYTLTASDVGSKITVAVTGTKSGYQSQTKTSAQTDTVAALAPQAPALSSQSLTPTPTITGDAFVDAVLTGVTGTWDAGVTLSYQWFRNATAIPGATTTSYTIGEADLGSTISLQVVSTKADYVTVTKASAIVGPVTRADLVAEAIEVVMESSPTPTISGATQIGSTLSATVGSWDAGAILSYQWYRDDLPIFGAVGTTYQLTQGDLGSTISFAVVGSKTGLSSITRQSLSTSIVTAIAQIITGGGTGGGGFSLMPIVAIPAISKPLPAGTKFALVGSDGNFKSVVSQVAADGKKLSLDVAGLRLDLNADSGFQVSADGNATLESGAELAFAASGYEPDSTVYFYLVPTSTLQQAGFRRFITTYTAETVELGSTKVDADGAFTFSSKPTAPSGDYVLQISGTSADGEEATLAIATKVQAVSTGAGALVTWTKKLTSSTAKLYAKNIVGKGKIQFKLNGKEVAWINAVDETDPKLRTANGAHYLVRTANLKTGKNVLEIWVDGARQKRVVYSR